MFFNGVTDKYLLVIEGRCALGNSDDPSQLTVTCKTGKDQFKKHFLGLSDNVSYFVEQTESAYADAFHYKVMFRPQSIIPDIDLRTQDEADDEWDESQSNSGSESDGGGSENSGE